MKRDGQKIAEDAQVVGYGRGMSNNVGEYFSLSAVLQWLLANKLDDEDIVIKSDSQLVVNQMSGERDVHGGLYVPYYEDAKKLAAKFQKIHFGWVPREENEEADELSRKAYESWCKDKGVEATYHKNTKTRIEPAGESCYTCKWVGFSGPHIGCYYNGKYRKWLPKSFAMTNKCEDYKKEVKDTEKTQ